MFDEFEIAIHLSIHWCQNNDYVSYFIRYSNISEYGRLLKNGGCECRISPNIPYLKLYYPDMYILSLMLMFYVKLFMKYGKASFLFSMAAILNIAQKWWKHQNLRLLPSTFWNSIAWRSSVPNFMLLSSSENLWPLQASQQ